MHDSDNTRQADHPIDEVFLDRWSPRSFTGEDIPVETLLGFFEAARWSPSSYNTQPWRFIWGRKGTPHFETLLGLLTGANPTWCKDASALVVVASAETMTMPGKDGPVPYYTHSFDAGSAWMAFALQATKAGWYTHGMAGLNFAEAAKVLNVPNGFRVEAGFAVGKRGSASQLIEPLQGLEKPSGRKPLAETVFEGAMPAA